MDGGSLKAWFAVNIINIIPIKRSQTGTTIQTPTDSPPPRTDVLEGIYEALEDDNIVIFFPEGTRGDAEKMIPFKKGIAYVAER